MKSEVYSWMAPGRELVGARWYSSEASVSPPTLTSFPLVGSGSGCSSWPSTKLNLTGCRERLGSSAAGSSEASTYKLCTTAGERKAYPEKGCSKAFRDLEVGQLGPSFSAPSHLPPPRPLRRATDSQPHPPSTPTLAWYHPPLTPHFPSGDQCLLVRVG